MRSSLVTGVDAIFEIEELKMRLKDRRVEVVKEVEKAKRDERAIHTRIANCEQLVEIQDQELEIEHGRLMSSVMKKKTLRCVALNTKNTAGNEVMMCKLIPTCLICLWQVSGEVTGGVELLCASEANSINVFDIHTGELVMIFSGDEEGRHLGAPEGHTSIIQSLHFFEDCIYSGGLDSMIFVWSVHIPFHHQESRLTCVSRLCVTIGIHRPGNASIDSKATKPVSVASPWTA